MNLRFTAPTTRTHCDSHTCAQLRPYLRLDVSVVVVLEQQRRRLGVVLASSDVQRGQPDLPFGVIFQQYGDHLVVALLESNGQRGEAVLGEKVREENI